MDRGRIDEHHGTENLLDPPLAAWFLGPKAEHGQVWSELISYIFQDYVHWRRNYFPNDPVVISRESRRDHERWLDHLTTELDTVLNALKAHYPFYSPRYVAHMLSEQTLPSVLGYFAGLLYNPNNVTDQAAPVTVRYELEVGRLVARMLGYNPRKTWAHLCSGGTIANLEALWVARTAQFVPFMLREYCARNKLDFEVKTPDRTQVFLRDLDDAALLSLRPNESIFMTRKLAEFEVKVLERDEEKVLRRINTAMKESPFNPRVAGFGSIVQLLGRRPVLFVSAAAHYSVAKAANVLGYGEGAVRQIPVTKDFRLDVEALREAIRRLEPDRHYLAGVVGIVGTTEEGAVDPIHEIAALRDQRQNTENASFWFHIDAAWGGYIRSLFCDAGEDGAHTQDGDPEELEALCNYHREKIAAIEKIPPLQGGNEQDMAWDNPDVYKAFITMKRADSITIDPHKLGYVPYPAGLVAFKNGLVTELLTQRAQYISDTREGVRGIDEPKKIEEVGSYILEGSKPGFVSTGCYLAHKSIPLTRSGHGKLMKTTVLNAKKLYRYLTQHRKSFIKFERQLEFAPPKGEYDAGLCPRPFTFVPLNDPDTNIVCYVAIPMSWKDRRLEYVDFSLSALNEANEKIQERLDIPQGERGTAMPYSKEFLVSRTTFEKQQYTGDSIKEILRKLRVDKRDYDRKGLIVLRSVIMNPHYHTANDEVPGIDYLLEFVQHLHRTAREVFAGQASQIR